MVAADHVEDKPPGSNKRKRSSTVAEQKRPKTSFKDASDLLLVFADDDRAQETLDYADDARPRSIRQRLQDEDYLDNTELQTHLGHVRDKLLENSKDNRHIIAITSLHKELNTLLATTKPLKLEDDKSATDQVKDGTTTFPDRFAERQTLFASTIVGPLFSSTAETVPATAIAGVSGNVRKIKVLPSAPAEVRCLEDLHQMPIKLAKRNILEAARQPIYTGQTVKRGTFEGFGLDKDAAGALLNHEALNMCIHHRKEQLSKREHSGSAPERNGHAADITTQTASDVTDQAAAEDITIDDDLLDMFASEADQAEDVSVMLLQLSTLQQSRLSEGPFSAPSDEEQALADRITNKLSSTISTKEIQPKQLLPKGVKSGYTFAHLGPSYSGTLPPTIGQAVRATYAHIAPLSTQPLSRSKSQIYPKFNPVNSQNMSNTKSQSTSTTHTTKAATPVPQ